MNKSLWSGPEFISIYHAKFCQVTGLPMKSMLNIHASQPPLFVFCFINNTKAPLYAIHQCASALTYLQKVVTSQLRPYSCHEYHHPSRYWISLVAQTHQMCSVMSEHSNSRFPDIDSRRLDCLATVGKLLWSYWVAKIISLKLSYKRHIYYLLCHSCMPDQNYCSWNSL